MCVAGLIDQIEPLLVDGFELEFYKAGAGKGIWRLYKNGRPYLERGLKQVTINDSNDGYNYRRKILKQLEEVGAVKPTQKHKPKEREPVVRSMPKKNDLQFSLDKAQRFMKDPKTDANLRGMSRDYIKLARLYVHVAKELKRERQRHAAPQAHPDAAK